MDSRILCTSSFPLVCIEGIDGVGKTTIAKRVATMLDGVYYKTPPTPFCDIRALIDQTADPRARFFFYLSAVAYASSEIDHLCRAQAVVCDRYLESTIAYHVTLDPGLRRYTERLEHVTRLADLTVLLVVDEEERLRRLKKRNAFGVTRLVRERWFVPW